MLCASQQRNQGLGGERQGHDPGGHGPVIEEARGLADLVGWLDIWFHDGGNGHRGNDAGEGHQGQLGRHGHASVKPW